MLSVSLANSFQVLSIYSQIENGAFCKYCVLFGCKAGVGVGNQTSRALCAVKFQKWKNALGTVCGPRKYQLLSPQQHVNSRDHNDSAIRTASPFNSIIKGKHKFQKTEGLSQL